MYDIEIHYNNKIVSVKYTIILNMEHTYRNIHNPISIHSECNDRFGKHNDHFLQPIGIYHIYELSHNTCESYHNIYDLFHNTYELTHNI